jgi:hypothetical protein
MRFAPLIRLPGDGIDDAEGVSQVVRQPSDKGGGGQGSRTAALMIATVTMSTPGE